MTRRHYRPEEIIAKLREAEVLSASTDPVSLKRDENYQGQGCVGETRTRR